jgi:hypothetical protein
MRSFHDDSLARCLAVEIERLCPEPHRHSPVTPSKFKLTLHFKGRVALKTGGDNAWLRTSWDLSDHLLDSLDRKETITTKFRTADGLPLTVY